MVVEKIKENGWKWVLQGVPALIAVLVFLIGSGKTLGDINARLKNIEDTQPANSHRLESLEQEIQALKLQMQELEDELRFQKKIDEQVPRRRVQYPQDQQNAGDGPPHF